MNIPKNPQDETFNWRLRQPRFCSCEIKQKHLRRLEMKMERWEREKKYDYVNYSCLICGSLEEYPSFLACPKCKLLVCIRCEYNLTTNADPVTWFVNTSLPKNYKQL